MDYSQEKEQGVGAVKKRNIIKLVFAHIPDVFIALFATKSAQWVAAVRGQISSHQGLAPA